MHRLNLQFSAFSFLRIGYGSARMSCVLKKPGALSTLLFSALLGVCWVFPDWWYSHSDTRQGRHWFLEKAVVPGWHYTKVPVAKSAEAILVADELVSGEFTNGNGELVRVFSAKRIREKKNEIGLFVHTPDRCWTETGWKLEQQAPDSVEVPIHSMRMILERRIFNRGAGDRELVLFGGLVGGQSLPYRLDHNLSVGMRHQLKAAADHSGATLRASDQRFWKRVWESFWSRRQLLGPKQFIRISTPLKRGEDIALSDALLRSFLPQWLEESDFSTGKNVSRQ